MKRMRSSRSILARQKEDGEKEEEKRERASYLCPDNNRVKLVLKSEYVSLEGCPDHVGVT